MFVADPAADAGGFREMTSLIRVELMDGRVLTAKAEFGKGSPTNPMTDDELTDKFLGCLEWAGITEGVGREVADRVYALARGSIVLEASTSEDDLPNRLEHAYFGQDVSAPLSS